MNLYSTAEIVKAFECDASTVHRAAAKLKPAAKRVGASRAFAFTDTQKAKLRKLIAEKKPAKQKPARKGRGHKHDC